MEQEASTICGAYAASQECRHYWIIERAAGPVSKGVCALCNAEREFKNDLRDCLKDGNEGYLDWLRGYSEFERKPQQDILSQAESLIGTTVE